MSQEKRNFIIIQVKSLHSSNFLVSAALGKQSVLRKEETF